MLAASVAALSAAGLVAGCGGGQRQDAAGTFRRSISRRPAAAKVDPKTGDVVDAGTASS